ncbi:MAG: endonuclease VIII [Ruminiclostridium sp.]|nr:endonuclease VIII [Ruminiclostridium sp.]
MIELPEAAVMAEQLNEIVQGKRITNVIANSSPHKFAWFCGDPQSYHGMLSGKSLGKAVPVGGMVEIAAEGYILVFAEGVNLRFHDVNDKRPQKHQLLLEFEDDSALSASIQMYGGLWCFRDGEFDNPYYLGAGKKPSPLSAQFDEAYFNSIINAPSAEKLSAKALLATEQRIPGLGNGVLQDILYNAGVHPKRKVKQLSETDKKKLFLSIKTTLGEMVMLGGRDTETDLLGCPGGYKTKLSKKTLDKPCPVCGESLVKEAYMGGSIYYCTGCQKQ